MPARQAGKYTPCLTPGLAALQQRQLQEALLMRCAEGEASKLKLKEDKGAGVLAVCRMGALVATRARYGSPAVSW